MSAQRLLSCAVDLVLITALRRELAVLLLERPTRTRWALPSAPWTGRDKPNSIAARLYRAITGGRPFWCEQTAACTRGSHPLGADFTLAFAATIAARPAPQGTAWHSISQLPSGIASKQRFAIAESVESARSRLDRAPLAFGLLPAAFTLSDAQRVYEILLGRRLHKASFRRTLLAARLVEGTDAWRSEGRGRPAQLYRYAPRKRRGVTAALRFDLVDV